MEVGYALMVCLGCFQAVPLLAGPKVPDRPAIRDIAPEDFRTSCFPSVDGRSLAPRRKVIEAKLDYAL